MDPQDVLVVALDGLTHEVNLRTAITINTQVGTTGPVNTVDPEDPQNIITVVGRTGYAIQSLPGTRFTASCGMSFDVANNAIDGDARFTQGGTVDCPNC